MTNHRSQPSRRFARLVVAALAVTALAAPGAVASPAIDPAASGTRAPAPTQVPVVRTAEPGFDWGSAAVGAGGAGAIIVLISMGGVLYASRGRMRGLANPHH